MNECPGRVCLTLLCAVQRHIVAAKYREILTGAPENTLSLCTPCPPPPFPRQQATAKSFSFLSPIHCSKLSNRIIYLYMFTDWWHE